MSFFSDLLTLSLILHINQAKQTQLMESLQCVNDYKSFVSCIWSESEEVQKLIKINLFYKMEERGNFKQMTYCSPNMDSQRWKWNCYRNQTFFSPLKKEYYTFKPDRKLEAQLNVSLFDNVQLPPPKELDISLTEEGDFLLTWKAGGGTNGSRWLDEALDYQVVYKREWESWERSTSVFVSNVSRCLLHHDDMVPGSNYIARVRNKPHQLGSNLLGYYSEWSSAVKWTTQEGDKGLPKNLRCLFNGLDRLSCSWEVRRELTGSVSFALFYKISLESVETQCSPVEEKELLDTLHVLQSCEIHVTNPKRLSQYLITVRPKEDVKMIEPVKNIKVEPPYELSVKTLKNQLYRLQWKVTECKFPRIYQVLYWEADKMLEKTQNISEDVLEFTFTFQSLKPGIRYKAKMRAKAHRMAYDGPWSEWSKECEWATERELPFWGFVLAVPAFIILAVVGLCCSKRYILRKKKEWEKNIPRPPSTFLLPGYFMKVQLPDSFEERSGQSSLEEEKFNSRNTLDRLKQVTCSNSLEVRSGNTRPLSAVFPNTETTGFSDVKPDQSLNHAEPSSLLAPSHNAEMVLAQQVFDFNGPYLMSLQESPVPGVQEAAAPVEMRERPVPMQYVKVPLGPCFQDFPLGREKGTSPPLCAVHSKGEVKLPLSGRRQEVSEGQVASSILEKGGNKGLSPQRATSANNAQNGILDYFSTEDLSRNTTRSFSFLSPMVALKEEMLASATMETSASQLSQTTDGPSSSELYLKKTDTVLPPEDQAPAVPSETSQDVFGEYFLTLPGTLESMPKEQRALSTKDPEENKSFLVFNPDGKSPIFLSQVGEYCFFPSTKPVTKPQEGYMGHQLAEDSHSLPKQACESKCVESEPQTISHICKV